MQKGAVIEKARIDESSFSCVRRTSGYSLIILVVRVVVMIMLVVVMANNMYMLLVVVVVVVVATSGSNIVKDSDELLIGYTAAAA
jgi:type IV secretory pathway VirB3-like protein